MLEKTFIYPSILNGDVHVGDNTFIELELLLIIVLKLVKFV